jgi:hypothetical protein
LTALADLAHVAHIALLLIALTSSIVHSPLLEQREGFYREDEDRGQ